MTSITRAPLTVPGPVTLKLPFVAVTFTVPAGIPTNLKRP